jgi:hypothetical protein
VANGCLTILATIGAAGSLSNGRVWGSSWRLPQPHPYPSLLSRRQPDAKVATPQGDDPVIGRQRDGALDRLDAGVKDLGSADMMGTEEGLQGGATCELRGFEGGPAAQEVAKEPRIFVWKPLEDVGEGVFEGTGQAIRQPDFVADHATAVFDELRQGAHGGALGG